MKARCVDERIEASINPVAGHGKDLPFDESIPVTQGVPRAANEVASVLYNVSSVLDQASLATLLETRGELGCQHAAIGSTNALETD